MKRPTWHKVRLWRFSSQLDWSPNIFNTDWLPFKQRKLYKGKKIENDSAKMFSDETTGVVGEIAEGRVIPAVSWPDPASHFPHTENLNSSPTTLIIVLNTFLTILLGKNYHSPARDGLRTGVLFVDFFFTIYNSSWQWNHPAQLTPLSFSIYISHILNFTRISTFLPGQKGVSVW